MFFFCVCNSNERIVKEGGMLWVDIIVIIEFIGVKDRLLVLVYYGLDGVIM